MISLILPLEMGVFVVNGMQEVANDTGPYAVLSGIGARHWCPKKEKHF